MITGAERLSLIAILSKWRRTYAENMRAAGRAFFAAEELRAAGRHGDAQIKQHEYRVSAVFADFALDEIRDLERTLEAARTG